MKLNQYNLIARIFPAAICSIPVIIFSHYFLSVKLADFFKTVTNINFIGNISLPLVFIFFFSQLNRFISKEIFEKRYFRDELWMPTTNLLLHSNEQYSCQYKDKIYKRILKDFNITLSTKKEEEVDDYNARKKIVEAVSLMRNKVGSGKLLLQHNIEYGFVRNLIGGSVIAIGFTLLNLGFFRFIYYEQVAFKISLFTGLLYFLPIIFSKKLLLNYGNLYAKRLIQEYIGFEREII